MSKPIIQIKGLTYTYPNSDQPALKDIDLEISKGEFIFIVGKSGCGKSTLARSLNGLIPHLFEGKMKGNIFINGKNTRKAEIWELANSVGLIFQNPESQLFTLTVEDELAFGPENLGLPREKINKRVNWALKHVGMVNERYKGIFNLSEGQKQRIAIAANLSMLPKILVLDEPTSNLDPEGAKSVFAILKTLKEKYGKTIILIDHRTHYAINYVDRVIVMDAGKIAIDSTAELLYNSKIRKKYGIRSPKPLSSLYDHTKKQHRHGGRFTHNEIVLKTEDLSYNYRNNGFSIRNINITIRKGENIGIMGPNGSGKTTLAKLLVGLLQPSKGKISLKGHENGRGSKKIGMSQLTGKIGLVLQNPDHQLFMDSVYNELAFELNNWDLSGEEINMRVINTLKVMDLFQMKDRHPHSLSEGEKQRTVLSASLVRETEILILDEPTSGMDGYHMDRLIDCLHELETIGITLILISHDLELLLRATQRIIVIANGKIVHDAVTQDILETNISELRITPKT